MKRRIVQPFKEGRPVALKKNKQAKKNKQQEQKNLTNQPIGADIAPDYVTKDLTGYRVPFTEK
jgi:hypothetical protein